MMQIRKSWLLVSLALVMCASARPVVGQERNLYWGDTHLHTSYSGMLFARGTSTRIPTWPIALRGASRGPPEPRESGASRPATRLPRGVGPLPVGIGAPVEGDRDTLEFQTAAWSLYVDAAERHNDPGTFTALIGWEWTYTPGGQHLHRVVFTPADAETAKQFLPASPASTGVRPEDLWNWLEATSDRLGIDFVAIPHNSNLSGGRMFDMVDSDGRPISAEYARTRMRWEPLVEVLQIKGTSETHPFLSPEDEFADFELGYLRDGNIIYTRGDTAPPDPADYVRTALLRGLRVEEEAGVNPYKFGLQGATDTHRP